MQRLKDAENTGATDDAHRSHINRNQLLEKTGERNDHQDEVEDVLGVVEVQVHSEADQLNRCLDGKDNHEYQVKLLQHILVPFRRPLVLDTQAKCVQSYAIRDKVVKR